ncbi:type II secretion system F family protein [Paenibacillus sp. GP183]|uniref:type II secretion system F family protein n=1 Tax=Paenibacillus sp. GP183 TaxID=1882751 RepID=UPI000899354D|nr:type II secretion system F family protein [Paenibacillus sp. GP183]SEC17373.1 tight adherence protein C [Paenibacillus sp. GP183]
MLYLSFFFTVALAVYTVFIHREEKSKRHKHRLSQVKGELDGLSMEAQDEAAVKSESALGNLLKNLFRPLRRSFTRRLQGWEETRIEHKLQQAGRPFNMSPIDYRILQLSLLILLPVLFGGYSFILGVGIGFKILFILAGFIAALLLPGYYLKLKTRQRSRFALRELPDVLDLLTVSLEAGLGFDSAISKMVAKKEGVLAGEFRRCLEEIRLGKTRREALTGVKERLVLDEMKVLISSILQAEKLGIGLVQVLRVQSHEVREKRKQRAEEEAMKAPVKMLFPLVLFIFPSIFIVLLGPAAIQFIQVFSNNKP